MNTVSYLFWLTKMAFSVVVYAWFISVPLFAACVIATVRAWRVGDRDGRAKIRGLRALYCFPAFMLILGTIFRKHPAVWLNYGVWGFMILLVCLGIVLVVRLRGVRLAASSHMLVVIWLSLCSLFVAGMSISDDWL
jgi:CDP-diglyceride synthetase